MEVANLVVLGVKARLARRYGFVLVSRRPGCCSLINSRSNTCWQVSGAQCRNVILGCVDLLNYWTFGADR